MTTGFYFGELGIFNGDDFVKEEVQSLITKFGCEVAIETGTYFGCTARYLASLVKQAHTIENHEPFYKYACLLTEKRPEFHNLKFHNGHSPTVLESLLPTIDKSKPVLFYLDAHVPDNYPLLDELKVIGDHCHQNAVIVIDDFYVPNENLQYDAVAGKPLDFQYIKESLNKIYDEYGYYYNNAQKANGKKVGKIYIFPVKSTP